MRNIFSLRNRNPNDTSNIRKANKGLKESKENIIVISIEMLIISTKLFKKYLNNILFICISFNLFNYLQ